MKWKHEIPGINFSITYEIDDEIVIGLHKSGVEGDTGHKVRQMIEWEYFLMSANRYRMAVLDEITLKYIVDNYDKEKYKIVGTISNLLDAMQGTTNDNTSTGDSENQSGPVDDAGSTI